MKPRKIYHLALIISLMGVMLSCGKANNKTKQPPVAKDGVIDLSNWDFNSDGPVELRGEWRFAWEDFLVAESIGTLREKYLGTIQVPSIWVHQKNSLKSGENLPETGFGTYILEIKIDPQMISVETPFSIYIKSICCAAQIDIWDLSEKKILSRIHQGKPSSNLENDIPIYVDQVSKINQTTAPRLMILARVSNYRSYFGGIRTAPQLGSHHNLQKEWFSNYTKSLFLVGALVFIGIYHLVLYIQRPEDKVSLTFFLFCTSIWIRELMVSEVIQQLGIGHSAIGYHILNTIEVLTIPLSVMAGGSFFLKMLPGKLLQVSCIFIM